MGVCVFDPEGIEFIDDAERDDPPWIIFEFKFREISQKIQHILKEEIADSKIGVPNHLKTTRKSSKTRSSTSALPAIDKTDSEGTLIFN